MTPCLNDSLQLRSLKGKEFTLWGTTNVSRWYHYQEQDTFVCRKMKIDYDGKTWEISYKNRQGKTEVHNGTFELKKSLAGVAGPYYYFEAEQKTGPQQKFSEFFRECFILC